eukprot:scaffold19902_cov93-Skeletonema_marinoi.AAC.2
MEHKTTLACSKNQERKREERSALRAIDRGRISRRVGHCPPFNPSAWKNRSFPSKYGLTKSKTTCLEVNISLLTALEVNGPRCAPL